MQNILRTAYFSNGRAGAFRKKVALRLIQVKLQKKTEKLETFFNFYSYF